MHTQIRLRTKLFAIAVINLIEKIPRNQASLVIIRQLIKSATSIGANYRAALRGKSRADFIMKLKIAEEEADETVYWLELLTESGLCNAEIIAPVCKEANEITAILTASVKTAKQNL